MARKILLADDSVTAQNMGRKILTDAGYDVITVNNGSAALKRVAELKPDLIVLDVYMPGYSGLEVCVRLKDAQETARIPVLLTVGKLEPFKPEEANRVRADGYIVKPFEASELLSALTRLEDRVVPAQSEGGRFSSSSAGIERFGASDPSVNRSEDDGDAGWKNRLRFPSKKKKEEPEPEPEPDFVTPSNFRDFRRGGGKAPAGNSPFPLSTAPTAAQEPAVIPDIPRDITPEELDALSELAAKLDGPPSPPGEAKIEEKTIPAVATAAEMPRPEFAVPEEKIEEAKTEPDVTVSIKQELEVPAAVEPVNAETAGTPVAARSEEVSPPPVESTTVEAEVAEAVAYKTEPAVAQEPAPVDREEEPEFASAVSPISETQPETDRTADGDPSVPLEGAPVIEPPAAASTIETVPVEESAIEQAAPVDESSQPASSSEPAGSSPSAEELAEALRFLTPAQTPASQTLAEAGAALADQLSRGAGSHWVAEAVPLDADEASASLESEMFRTFARAGSSDTASPEAPAISAGANEQPVTSSAGVAETEAPGAPSAVAVAESKATPDVPVSEPEAPFVKPAEAMPEESEAPATFADAVQDREEEGVSARAVTITAETQTHEEVASSEDSPGGEEDMAKENKGKDGKSTWHQIRSGAPASSNDAVEAAKQSEDSPKTMAAAASADGASDPTAIASIVDSVLADLRPKIVEEIAKQLSKK